MADGDTERTVVLRNSTRWWLGGLYFLLAAGSIAALVLNAFSVESFLVLLGAAGFTLLGARALRSSISLDTAGVTARADRFTKRLAWTDIDRFDLRSNSVTTGLGAWTRDGKWVRLMDRAGLDANNWYGKTVDQLQAELELHRQD